MKTIAIIGGGWSGILTAIQLLEKSKNISVKIINSGQPIGLGVAYSTTEEAHLLNVPAGKMSAFPNNPKHFTDWLIANGHSIEQIEKQFLPRLVYGKYISELVSSLKQNEQLEIINAKAIDIQKQESAYSILLDNENSILADKIVLALGNFLPATPKAENTIFFESPGYYENPWNTDYLKDIQTNQNILLIGTGLTMVDCMVSLKSAGFAGKIFVVSPRGYTPAAHSKTEAYPDFYSELKGKTLLEMVQIVRKHIKIAESKKSSWIGVIDSLRPHVQEIWITLSQKDKKQFVSHIRHIWGVARHRLPKETHTELMELKAKGKLEIIGGRIIHFESSQSDSKPANGNVTVSIQLRGSTTVRELNVSKVINCTGPQSNYQELKDALIQNLLAKKMIISNELKMGIETNLTGQVVQDNGKNSDDIYAIGSLLRGVLWETTAVPEISKQAEQIAKQIVDSIK